MITNSIHVQNISTSNTSMFEITSPATTSKSRMFPPGTTAPTYSQKDSHVYPTPISFPSWACLLVEGECCYSDFSGNIISLFSFSISLFVFLYSKHFASRSRLIYSTYIRSYIPLLCRNPHLIPLALFSSPTPFRSESQIILLVTYFSISAFRLFRS